MKGKFHCKKQNNMRINLTVLVFSFLVMHLKAQTTWSLPTPKDPQGTTLIPYPNKVTYNRGKVMFSALRMNSNETMDDSRKRLKAELDNISVWWYMNPSNPKNTLSVSFHKVALSEEAYTLEVTNKKIIISASDYSGFFNGLQTLRQLIKKKKNKYEIPLCIISDKPAFKIRGVMLDVGRNFVSIDFIKNLVRRLSHYKINLLHLHLTDNPGWRVEIKKHKELTDSNTFWKTRQPGKYYTQDELKNLCIYCDSLGIRVMPEIDMPGHSAAFAKAINADMQSERGISVLKEALDEIIPLFNDPWFHVGSDEVHFKRPNFMPEMIDYVRNKKKEVVVWYPGFSFDSNTIRMCWGENESAESLNKSARYIDTNGFYMDWMDSQTGVLQTFFQQPCEVPIGNDKALGSIMCVWTDGALSSEQRLLEQYPFYPCILTFSERIWRGSQEKRKDLMAQLPQKGTNAWNAFSEFEKRLTYHRDHYFKNIPFAYVQQSTMLWSLIGPFDHHGQNNMSFEPEQVIKKEYRIEDSVLKWNPAPAYGGAIQIRSLYAMFNAHLNKHRLNHWPTLMSPSVGKKGGTCYGLMYVKSPKQQDVYLMFGLNGMWGHSGGYRSGRAPEQGSWDFEGGDVWLNNERVEPPHWPFESLPWEGWGKGRIEKPLTEEGYFYRAPVKIKLKKGINKILVRTVSGAWKGDSGDRKWQFCCMPVLWDGMHYKEVNGLEYLPFTNNIVH